MVFMSLLIAVPVMIAGLTRSTVDQRDVTWIVGPLPRGGQEAIVLTRYLERHRLHRFVGAVLGVLFAIVVGTRLYGSVDIGIGRQSPLADVLFCGLAGSIVGALSAETFRLSEPRRDVVIASLTQREPAAMPNVVGRARALAAASLAAGVITLLVTGDAASLAIAVGGVALTGAAEATRRAVTGRRRPLLSDRARGVDARMRWLAHGAINWLQLAAAVLVAGWVIAKAGDPDLLILELLRGAVVIACLVAAIVFLRRGAPHPPRGWEPSE